MDAANLRDGNADGIRGDGTMEQEAGSRPLGRMAVVQESDGRALPATIHHRDRCDGCQSRATYVNHGKRVHFCGKNL